MMDDNRLQIRRGNKRLQIMHWNIYGYDDQLPNQELWIKINKVNDASLLSGIIGFIIMIPAILVNHWFLLALCFLALSFAAISRPWIWCAETKVYTDAKKHRNNLMNNRIRYILETRPALIRDRIND